MNRAELQALLDNKNVIAFLRCIREGESDQTQSAYFRRYHPRTAAYVDSLEGGHPRIYEELPDGSGRKSSAFGAFQFVWPTWQYVGQKYGLEDDISQLSQDLHAVALLVDCDAIPPILKGDLREACERANNHWASLPGSELRDGGSKMKWERFQRVWDKYSGTSAPIRDAVPETKPVKGEEDMALPVPLIIALGESLLRFLPAFGSGSKTSNRNIEMTQELGQTLINAAKEVVPNAPNEQGAVQQILDDPILQKRFTAECAVNWSDIAPFVEATEKSRKEARNFMLEMTSDGPMWRAIGYGVLVGLTAIIIIVGGGWMLWEATIASWASDAMRQENQAFLRNVILLVVGFLFGSSYSSHRKDAAREREGL